jgi:hypothetical protein
MLGFIFCTVVQTALRCEDLGLPGFSRVRCPALGFPHVSASESGLYGWSFDTEFATDGCHILLICSCWSFPSFIVFFGHSFIFSEADGSMKQPDCHNWVELDWILLYRAWCTCSVCVFSITGYHGFVFVTLRNADRVDCFLYRLHFVRDITDRVLFESHLTLCGSAWLALCAISSLMTKIRYLAIDAVRLASRAAPPSNFERSCDHGHDFLNVVCMWIWYVRRSRVQLPV